MRLRPGITVVTVILLARGAGAQEMLCLPARGPTGPGAPVLHLTGHTAIKLAPDELVADLTALANAPGAVAAQRRVNNLEAEAGRAAGTVAEVKAAFRDYSVQFVDDKPPHWIARQTVELKGRGQRGAARPRGTPAGARPHHRRPRLAGLGRARRDSPSSGHHHVPEAVAGAISEDADALGMQIDRFRSVRVNGGARPIPLFRGVNGAMPMAAAMAPPRATPEQQDITADVSAVVVLRPAAGATSPKR